MPTMTRGRYAYDFGDTGKMTPLIKMYTLGPALYRRQTTPAGCAITA